jgi:hypothetical protein
MEAHGQPLDDHVEVAVVALHKEEALAGDRSAQAHRRDVASGELSEDLMVVNATFRVERERLPEFDAVLETGQGDRLQLTAITTHLRG